MHIKSRAVCDASFVRPGKTLPGRAFPLSCLLAFCLLLLLALTSGCSPKAKAARHLKRADKYFDAGEYAKAEVEYLNTLHFSADNPRVIGRLATIYYDQARVRAALDFLTRASELAPTNADYQVKLGTIQLGA